MPVVAVGGVQQLQQSFRRLTLSAHRRNADDAIFVLERVQHLGLLDPLALLVG